LEEHMNFDVVGFGSFWRKSGQQKIVH